MKIITKEIIAEYKKYLINEEKSYATIEKYSHDVNAFYIWNGNKEVEKIGVIEYKQLLMEKYAPASVNSHISSLNSFFDYMNWYECKVKMLKIQKQIFADKDKELTRSEYERLLKAAQRKNNKRLFLVMQTICSTGIRVSELKFITVESLKYGQASIACKGKHRTVFLPKRLCKMLKEYIKKRKIFTGSVFVTKNGKPLNRTNIWGDMKKLCGEAKVSKGKVFPHNLRHLFARTYYSIQKDVVRLADILGHSSVNTTRIYTMETGDIHRKQIEKLGFLVC